MPRRPAEHVRYPRASYEVRAVPISYIGRLSAFGYATKPGDLDAKNREIFGRTPLMKKKFLDEKARGITLVEVMIAVVVLSVATLGVMGALTYGVVSNEYAGTYSEANHAAREA